MARPAMSSGSAESSSVRRGGRPREFDPEAALAAALDVFLSRGFVSASVTDLTGRMGISRPSLYSCFGSKELLFRQALDLHARRTQVVLAKALAASSIRAMTACLLREAMTNGALAGAAGSFLGLLATLPGDPQCAWVRGEITRRQAEVAEAIESRFAAGRHSGEISADASPAALACLLQSLSLGLSAHARGGASDGELEEHLSAALAAMDCAARSRTARRAYRTRLRPE